MNDNPSNFRPQTSATGSQQYMDADVRMASPAKLRLMLLERSVEVAGMLSALWRSGKSQGPNEHSLNLLELISELLSGVAGGSNDAENKLCLQVADLYVFLLQHLVVAQDNSDADSVDEIQLVLQAETETWRAAVALAASNQMAAVGGNVTTTLGNIPAPSFITRTNDAGTPQSGGLNFSA